MFSKGVLSLLNLNTYGEYIGSQIYFSKPIYSFKFIFYQSFVGRVIFLKRTMGISLKEDGRGEGSRGTGTFHSPG